MIPISAAENALDDDIRLLTFYTVARLPRDMLTEAGMQLQQCHNNAFIFAATDPTGNTKAVSGWWKRGDVFVFHSVVIARGTLQCVTPHIDPNPITFAPDTEIEWARDGGVLRKGKPFPAIVRTYPAAVIASATAARDALLAGADPRSVDLPF